MVLNLNQRSRIIWRAGQKKSLRVIADEIGCHHQTVANIIHNYLINGTLEPKKRIRKRKTTEEDMIIVNAAIIYNNLSVEEMMEKVREMVDLNISRMTFNSRILGKSYFYHLWFSRYEFLKF
jgi:hypothetical protein